MKMITYLSNLWHNKVLYWFNSIKTIHQRLLSIDVNDLAPKGSVNPYQALMQWLIDVVENGLIFAIAYFLIGGGAGFMHFLRLTFGFGFGYEALKRLVKAIKSKPE